MLAREKNVMKILLQHTRTLLYLRAIDAWTRSKCEAQDFRHSQAAIDFAHRNQLQDVQLAVKFEDPDDDVVAPLPAANQASAMASSLNSATALRQE